MTIPVCRREMDNSTLVYQYQRRLYWILLTYQEKLQDINTSFTISTMCNLPSTSIKMRWLLVHETQLFKRTLTPPSLHSPHKVPI